MRLGEILKLWRNVEGANIRDVAEEIGISKATLSRIENDKPCDLKSLTKLIVWLIG